MVGLQHLRNGSNTSGKGWGASTINGNAKRGTGILNNELYVGRLVWNRLRYVKDQIVASAAQGLIRFINGSSRRSRNYGLSPRIFGTGSRLGNWLSSAPRVSTGSLARCGNVAAPLSPLRAPQLRPL